MKGVPEAERMKGEEGEFGQHPDNPGLSLLVATVLLAAADRRGYAACTTPIGQLIEGWEGAHT